MVPARIKRIDRGLARPGVDWSFPSLAGLDPGRSDSRLAGSDLAPGSSWSWTTMRWSRSRYPPPPAAPQSPPPCLQKLNERQGFSDDGMIDYPAATLDGTISIPARRFIKQLDG
jgi:hypothetical protein